jgi:alginate O-acetyltransferase complex protein AlgI
MVFANLTFLYIFLPLNLLLYYAWRNADYRNLLLTLLSFAFYAWGEPIWITLLIFSGSIDYVHGLLVEKYRGTRWQKWPLVSSLVLNLSLLATFKYSGFIVGNVNAITGLSFEEPSFALPIGISFYTFQTISYVVDVYKNEVKAQKSFLKFMMFVSLYHQLVAGPIVRYAHIADEIDRRQLNIHDISHGITRFCIGLFKKVCIANIAGKMVETYMSGNLATLSVAEAWWGIMMFAVQIYFDFSAYSDMAIGLGRMFGFHYHENFHYPYMAKSAVDFWRRWHISLSTFFRDYVYIPLGGNKKHLYRNLFVVWLLTGIWHGASWNFILWGLFWGMLIVLERLFLSNWLAALPRFVGHVYLLLAMLVGWVLFYFTDTASVFRYLAIMFGMSGQVWYNSELTLVLQGHVFWFLLTVLLCFPVYHWVESWFAPRLQLWAYTKIMLGLVLLILSTAMLVGNSFNPFLYFRF